MTTSCELGFDDNGTLLALKAANDSHPSAELVKFTDNSSTGVTLGSFETSLSAHGQVITAQLASAFAPDIPFFLAPGQTYSAVIDLSNLGSKFAVSKSTFLQSTCAVANWTS
jgi:hypothetical protein